MIKKRVITACVAIPVALAAIFYLPFVYFASAVGMLVLGAAWEWSNLNGYENAVWRVVFVGAVLVGLAGSALVPVALVMSIACVAWAWIAIALFRYQRNPEHKTGFKCQHARALAGFVILVAMWVALVMLRSPAQAYPRLLFTYFLCLIWVADIGAFFAGKRFGKTLLASNVSPKKTREGLYGGMIASGLVAMVGSIFLESGWYAQWMFFIVSFLAALVSVIGDLGVSLFKRLRDVKDSGNFFPGHGGILDRLDSVAAASVIFLLGTLVV